eukprot:5393524-Prymnesium_polylepis.1
MAFIDLDEFIVVKAPVSHPARAVKPRPLAAVHEFFGELNGSLAARAWPAVALPWRLFGTSGHVARPAGPVIAAYHQRASSHAKDWRSRSYKSVGNMAACRAATVHVCTQFARGWTPALYTVNGQPVGLGKPTLRASQLKYARIYLAHFRTRSLEDWNSRSKRGDAGATSHKQAAKGAAPEEYNEVEDRTIPQNVDKRIRQCATASRSRGAGASEAIAALREVLLGEPQPPLATAHSSFAPGACLMCWLQASGPACGGVGAGA